MSALDYEGAKRYALERLEKELSPELYYHSLVHTRDDVALATERFAEMEGVSGDNLLILLTAVYFHDVGFAETIVRGHNGYINQNNHEEASIEIAWRVLPAFGYQPLQIETLAGIIQATKLPQSPKNLLEEIMADADLDSLGRDDFWSTSIALREEMAAFGTTFSEEEWFTNQLLFLTSHTYFTQSAKKIRGVKKEQNIKEVRRLLQSLYGWEPAG